MLKFVVFSAVVATAIAGCDNQCSGHGTCGLNGVCTCYDNWGLGLSYDSGDCSERICPFEFAWVDAPDSLGQHHKYAECAAKGICDRDTGSCECFPGYEGKACQRTACPNDCSGHGQCEYIENMQFAATTFDKTSADGSTYFAQEAHQFDYYYWDKQKTRGCVCDPEWADVDCSKRMCPYGNDVMDHRQDVTNQPRHNTQHLLFEHDHDIAWADEANNTFALTFKSKLNETFTTRPIIFDAIGTAGGATGDAADQYTMSRAIESALLALPNRVIDGVKVAVDTAAYSTTNMDTDLTSTIGATDNVRINVTFTGSHVQGKQHLLQVKHFACADGCTPLVTGLELKPGTHAVTTHNYDSATGATGEADYNSYECGRRGKCDYDSGVCECFEGYTGIACNTITALV